MDFCPHQIHPAVHPLVGLQYLLELDWFGLLPVFLQSPLNPSPPGLVNLQELPQDLQWAP